MARVTITAADQGPYEIRGPVELGTPDGRRIAASGEPLFLCRCGASTSQPFCDSVRAGTPATCARQDRAG